MAVSPLAQKVLSQGGGRPLLVIMGAATSGPGGREGLPGQIGELRHHQMLETICH